MSPDVLPLPNDARFATAGGVEIVRRYEPVTQADPFAALAQALDDRAGLLLRCAVEFPGRYRPQALGFVDPPVRLCATGDRLTVTALNRRGAVLLPAFTEILRALPFVDIQAGDATETVARAMAGTADFAEEQRTRQPGLFAILRAFLAGLASPLDRHLGFYGAFGYDLAFQLEPIAQHLTRDKDHRDLVLYLPDCILIEAPGSGALYRLYYDFTVKGQSTAGMSRATGIVARGVNPAGNRPLGCDHAPGAYRRIVELARKAFAAGDLFEVVPGQTFSQACPAPPSAVYRALSAMNPAPYGALINLGEGEHLVAASPEIYVRVQGDRVETCPISGTIARGGDAVSDAEHIRILLNSAKDEAELTMCTDVDRNDKARICQPGSIRILGRRQIELYSRLIHTVDHVEGRLRSGFDGLDAFLSHSWAVTVTGAPKRRAMQFIERHEASVRRWYGGAFGGLTIDGGVDTGLTLRTVRLKDGIAEIRAGATLLFDSDPQAEDTECHLKASALRDAVKRAVDEVQSACPANAPRPAVESRARPLEPGQGRNILFVDHEDSFVHTLASYFRETGADVTVLRPRLARAFLAGEPAPSLVVLSPGPGIPADFDVASTIAACLGAGVAIFGVCLGLQGIVEYFGGALYRLERPMHGVASAVRIAGGRLFDGIRDGFYAGRYHSLAAAPETLPACLRVTATTGDGVIMAVEHRSLPIDAVQFHPESLMSLAGESGRRLIGNVARLAFTLPKAA